MTGLAGSVDDLRISRRDLVAATGPDTRARRVVAGATATLELMVDTAERGRTVDGWRSADGLVWHVRGDLDTPRAAIVTPAAHLPAVVGRMVALGPRRTATEDVVVTADRLRDPDGLPGGIARVWALRGPTGTLGVVDQGPDGGLWQVAGQDGAAVTLRPVSPLDVWLALARV